jgi:hypothetical protein
MATLTIRNVEGVAARARPAAAIRWRRNCGQFLTEVLSHDEDRDIPLGQRRAILMPQVLGFADDEFTVISRLISSASDDALATMAAGAADPVRRLRLG